MVLTTTQTSRPWPTGCSATVHCGIASCTNGRAYTRRVFNWPAIVDRYDTLADRILTRVTAPATVPPG